MKKTTNLGLTLYEPDDKFHITESENSLNANMQIIDDELESKVDKVTGKSLIEDSEIERLSEVNNYDDTELRNLVNSKANLTDIPTKVSELQNDSNYITSIPSEYITETELNNKGYLTSIPSDYKTKTENDTLYQPKGTYLTSVPSEYVTETELNNKGYLTEHQDLSDYAKMEDMPTKVSDLTNDKGYLTIAPVTSVNGKTGAVSLNAGDIGAIATTELNSAVNNALSQAKASGEFDGDSGVYVGSDTPDSDANVWIDMNGDILTFEDIRGEKGKDGYSPIRGIDYWTTEDIDTINTNSKTFITNELAKRGQLKPEFANNIAECTDTTKLYVLPDGYIYAYSYQLVDTNTNQIPLSINSDGSQFVGEKGEDGYSVGYRLGAGNGVADSNVKDPTTAVTGFIPVTQKDNLYFKNFNLKPSENNSDMIIVGYNASFSRVVGTVASSLSGMSYVFGTPQTDTDGKLVALTEMNKYNDIRYIRFCAPNLNSSTIISKSPILEPTKEYRWASTGHAFVPADYEERIIEVEELTASHEDRLKTLETYGADSTSSADIPAYIKEEADSVMNRLAEKQGNRNFTIVALSDFHYQNYTEKYPDTVENSVDNLKRASKAISYMLGRIHIDAVATLGDNGAFGPGDDDSMAKAHRWLKQVNEILAMTQQTGVIDFRTPGNHDRLGSGNTAIMPDADIFRYITGYNRQLCLGDVPGGWGYYDFIGHKLRVIVLNTAECEGKSRFNLHSGYHMSNNQLNWLIKTLDMSNKEDASEWQILILSHHRADDYQEPKDGSEHEYILPNILNAYKTGSSYSATITTEGISVSCNFANKNKAKLIGQIHGHHHNYKFQNIHFGKIENTNQTNIMAVGTPTTNFVTNGNSDNAGNTYTSVKDTAEETAFCVYSIDLDNHKIYAIHYGNGLDREINY
jgi:hypothetical protein